MTLWILILDHQVVKKQAALVVTHLLSQRSTSTIVHTVLLVPSIQRQISSFVGWVVEKEARWFAWSDPQHLKHFGVRALFGDGLGISSVLDLSLKKRCAKGYSLID